MTSEVYFWKSIDKNLSYIDIVLTYIALRNDATLLTFDDAMMRLYQKIRETKHKKIPFTLRWLEKIFIACEGILDVIPFLHVGMRRGLLHLG